MSSKPIQLNHHMAYNLRIRVEWKPADLWIGAFFKTDGWRRHVWICLVPMLPIHISWDDVHVPETVKLHVYNQDYERIAVADVDTKSFTFKEAMLGNWHTPDGTLPILSMQPHGDTGKDYYLAVHDPRLTGPHEPDTGLIGKQGWGSWEEFYDDYADRPAPNPISPFGKEIQP